MSYKIIYLDEAKQDVKKAKAWYKKQLNGLQKKFAIAVIDAINKLQIFPTAYTIRYRNIRIIHTEIFPYGIHFYIDDISMTIVITAIIHNYRNIENFVDRI